jgi:S-adenosylmethionine:tRNA ribosyltransferase-isomerase
MKTSDFFYELPKELIAQTPLKNRAGSRLMTLGKHSGEIAHKGFEDIVEYLSPGDCLVLNDTKVIPARLIGVRPTGGRVEILLLSRREGDVWEALAKPGRKAKPGDRVLFGDGKLEAIVLDNAEDGKRIVELKYDGLFENVLDELGKMPLPPYIKEELEDRDRYQTVYAINPGSAAAPTAGLHFTDEILDKIKSKGAFIEFVTLHVGLGTFRPVKAEDITGHHMHQEYCEIGKETADRINKAKSSGMKIIACGTTSCRTLESFARDDGFIEAGSKWTGIFIYPGYKFKAIDALLTNFHLPESTLLMLVSALAGRENVLRAYNEAIQERYRFFSFGDAMLVI